MKQLSRGFSLVDIIVGVALLLIFFLSLFGILRASLLVSSLAKASQDATAIAQTQIEYLRGLSYDALGTQNGIPAGDVPQFATTTENGVTYVTHTFISYVDSAADGSGSKDANGIISDYKQARVETSYVLSAKTNSVVVDSWFAPPGIESSNGGGTLLIRVVDAAGALMSGASVQILNAATSPTVNITTASNIDGQVFLPGAAISSKYQVHVYRNGYSSADTYARDTTNQNPSPGYLTVVKNQTTTSTFAIDLLSHLSMKTFSPVATSTFSDTFTDDSHVAHMSSTTVSGGALTLAATATSGNAQSAAVSSAYLSRWGIASVTTTLPSGTDMRIHIYDSSGILVPDTALPGNSTGFTTSPIELSRLSVSLYPSLALGATLTTTGTSTPAILSWSLSYAEGPVPLPNASFTLTGSKTIGSKGDHTPIYKTTVASATDNDGVQLLNLEWDSYALKVTNYDIEDACPAPPYALSPGTTVPATLLLGPRTTNSMRVYVTDNTGAAVSGATVTLSKTGFTGTTASSVCGSAYFGNLVSGSAYTVKIVKSGYTTTSYSNVTVSGATSYNASFP